MLKITSNLPVIFFASDQDGTITLLEGGGLSTLGIVPARFIGRSVFDVYANFPSILDACRRTLKGEASVDLLEFGDRAFDVWYSPIVGENETITGITGIAIEATQRKLTEDLLQYQTTLLQSVSDAIISTDIEFIIKTWNAAAEEIYGWRSDEAVGKSVEELIKTESPSNWAKTALEQVEQTGNWLGEFVQHRKDGVKITTFVSISLIDDHLGNPSGLVIVARDITTSKEAAQRALELVLEREKVHLLREFISDISHDLKTPLTIIQTGFHLMRRKNPEMDSRHIGEIDIQLKRLNHMLDDMLVMSQLDKAAFDFDMMPVNIQSLAQAIVNDQKSLAAKKNLTLTFLTDQSAHIIQGDESQLYRALTNVVSNALQYTLDGGKITIQLQQSDQQTVIEVMDTGIGIDDTDLPHIFERFYRADKARGTERGGSGLGLAIAKKIIEGHKGIITVRSTVGQGTTFRITLPGQ